MIPLRPYQEEAVNAAREVVKVGGHPLIANATGTGKTRLGLAICATAISRGRWCLWLAYGVSLLRQTVKAGAEFGIVGEAVQAPKVWPVAPFMAVSLATLAADGRFDEFRQAMGSPPAVVVGMRLTRSVDRRRWGFAGLLRLGARGFTSGCRRRRRRRGSGICSRSRITTG